MRVTQNDIPLSLLKGFFERVDLNKVTSVIHHHRLYIVKPIMPLEHLNDGKQFVDGSHEQRSGSH
ncbi:hypothetical protein L210DRAFT_2200337 [Boletus edulis BED1]|uniref:Uncharacterized protein n=1 Tax=Boletus edulis BED1 TaxID=1328754 RepID=A0AAD4BE85_BOLED|nr:hypothetical protein L210DRAFT_2200337 [Boletus edulis BED1]